MIRMLFSKRRTLLQRLLVLKATVSQKISEITVSGSIVSFVTNLVSPMEVTAAIEPVQDLHGQSNPYPPGGGKNLLDEATYITSTSTSWQSFQLQLKPNTTYVYSVDDTNINKNRVLTEGTTLTGNAYSNAGSPAVFTTDATALVTFGYYSSSSGTKAPDFHHWLEEGSTAGDYTPYSNICPISGWTGANVTRTGKNLLDISSAVLNKNIDASGNINDNNSFMYVMIKVESSKDYVLSFNSVATSSTTTTRIHGYDKYGNWKQQISSISTTDAGARIKPISVPNDVEFIAVSTRQSFTDFMLEEGSTASAYEAFGTVYQISFPTPTGTVYGGTLTVNKDGSGDLVVNRASYLFDSNTTYTPSQSSAGVWYIQSEQFDTTNNSALLMTNAYKTVTNSTVSINGTARIVTKKVTIYDNRFTTSENVQTVLSSQPILAVVPLANPITYTLTAEQVGQILSLKGENNVWADCGNVTVTYSKKG